MVPVRQEASGPDQVYDRDFVLFGPLRETVLDLWQVQQYGAHMFGDADSISLYGMRPDQWCARGVRLLGRTVVECTRDELARVIAGDVAALAAVAPASPPALVLDPFAGSGNTLYWLQRMIPGSTGVGFEIDPVIGGHTSHNLALVDAPIDVVNSDYAEGLRSVEARADQLIVVFVAPPWGHAFDPDTGLDLGGTEPPIGEIVDIVAERLAGHRLLIAVQAFERLDSAALDDVTARFDWSFVHRYDINPPGRNPALVLGTLGWMPESNPLEA
jgi:hypothetical protein